MVFTSYTWQVSKQFLIKKHHNHCIIAAIAIAITIIIIIIITIVVLIVDTTNESK